MMATRESRPLVRRIVFMADDFVRLRAHVLDGGEDEEAAVLLAGVGHTVRDVRLLIREVIPVPDAAFVRKGAAGLTIHPDFLAPLVKRCREEGWALVLVHSHPFSREGVRFSAIDDGGEQALFPRIRERIAGRPVGAMVFGQTSLDARLWLPGETAGRAVDRVTVVCTDSLRWLTPTGAAHDTGESVAASGSDDRRARQSLALGATSRKALAGLHVAVVGAGGLGSLVYQQLVHLGVGYVDVIDPDVLEDSNLSRVVWSTPADIGRPKVTMLTEAGRRVAPEMAGTGVQGDVKIADVAARLLGADLVVGCTDNLTSRLVLNRLAHQYYLPLLDLGVDVQLREDDPSRVRAIGGRVMLVSPDGPCLGCLGVLDPEVLAREAGVAAPNGYLRGHDEPAPSVISFNGVVASLAVSEILRLVTGYADRPEPVYHRYDGVRGLVRAYALRAEQACETCREVRGAGDALPLPVNTMPELDMRSRL